MAFGTALRRLSLIVKSENVGPDIRLALVESCLAWTFSELHLPVTTQESSWFSDDHAEFHGNHGGSGGQGSSKTNDHWWTPPQDVRPRANDPITYGTEIWCPRWRHNSSFAASLAMWLGGSLCRCFIFFYPCEEGRDFSSPWRCTLLSIFVIHVKQK